MAKEKPKMANETKKAQPNLVWVELPKPNSDAHAEVICARANRMLLRASGPKAPGEPERRGEFSWHPGSRRYWYGDQMGATELEDWGHWFNLDFLGREINERTELRRLADENAALREEVKKLMTSLDWA